MSRSLIFCATKIPDCIGILTSLNCKYKNIKLNDSAAPIVMAEFLCIFALTSLCLRIFFTVYMSLICRFFFKPKESTDYSNSLLFQLVKLFNMLHALVAVENCFLAHSRSNFKKALLTFCPYMQANRQFSSI